MKQREIIYIKNNRKILKDTFSGKQWYVNLCNIINLLSGNSEHNNFAMHRKPTECEHNVTSPLSLAVTSFLYKKGEEQVP
jgi:hypothetical protein